MDQTQMNNRKKDRMALCCIALAVAGLILGIKFPQPLANAFSVGTIMTFVAFLLSLGSVKDKGNNLPAMIAFLLSFAAMAAAIFFSSIGAA